MPQRLRPTARLLTPAGWACLVGAALVAGAVAAVLVVGLPRA